MQAEVGHPPSLLVKIILVSGKARLRCLGIKEHLVSLEEVR